MTFLYPGRTTVRPGDTLPLHASTLEPCRVHLARLGCDTVWLTPHARPFPAGIAQTGAPDEPWAWPIWNVSVPKTAAPGAYLARAVSASMPFDARDDARDASALFVVRDREVRPVLVLLPLFTYHAYATATLDPAVDDVGGACLYTGAAAVTLARPGGGIGGHSWDEFNPDAYDRTSPRQSFAHWDRKGLAWLERERVRHDVATDLDLHEDPTLLSGRRLLVLFGHHEYWTDAMRDAVTSFVAHGGNVALFGANALWFRVSYDPAARTIARAGAWATCESELTGASYRYGGGAWAGPRAAVAMEVDAPEHWAFAGTGLTRGASFGAGVRLVGYECDGTPIDGPPNGAREIAHASLRGWDIAETAGELSARARASFVVREGEGAGTFVHGGSVDWPRAIEHDPVVARIARNVVHRLAMPAGSASARSMETVR